ncbi:MAG: glutamate racemase [Crocinitomicaceae bacterium]|jgi:glutamate racemase
MGPIGVFDSGYGGLTILNDLRERLPQYDYLYLGDNARAPYGTRSFDVVYEFTLQAVNELFDRGCELVILACNTASAKALRTIQKKDLPLIGPNKRVLGVIRPSAEIVGSFTSTNAIGILATQGTVKSRSYEIEIGNFAPNCKVYQQACPLWVTLIENNEHETDAGREFIRHDVKALLSENKHIDTLVLGCTHYPVLKSFIESIIPKNVRVVAQGKIVAKSLDSYLDRHPEMEEQCTKGGTVQYLTSESTSEFDQNAAKYTDDIVRSSHIQLH